MTKVYEWIEGSGWCFVKEHTSFLHASEIADEMRSQGRLVRVDVEETY